MFLLKLRTLFCFIGAATFLTSSAWSITEADFRAENEAILELSLYSGEGLKNALIAYQVKDNWYLPLFTLSESLGFFLSPLPTGMGAEGHLIFDSKKFYLNILGCTIKANDETRLYPCEEVLAYDQEIFVNLNLLSLWFPVDFSVESLKSQLIAKPREKLAIQLKQERDNNAKRIRAAYEDNDPGFPRKAKKFHRFAGPTIDQRLGTKIDQSQGSVTRSSDFDTALGWETYGLDSYFHVAGTSDKLGQARLTFGKKDPDAKMLGDLSATEVCGFDVDMPVMPMVSVGALKRGVTITNEPLGRSSTFSAQNFQGNLLPGWEVELYQNEILIGRHISDLSGRYTFRNVPLIYGVNNFRLVFYGPFGQRRTESHTYQIGSNLLKKNVQTYRVGMAVDQGNPIYTFLYNRGLSDRWTASVGTSRLDMLQYKRTNYFGLLGISGVTDNIFINLTSVINDRNGSAQNIKARVPFDGFSLGGEYVFLNQFQSEFFNAKNESIQQVSQAQADLNFFIPVVPRISVTVDFTNKRFQNDIFQSILRNRLSTGFSKLLLNNELSYNFDSDLAPLLGKADSIYLFQQNRIRLGLSYTKQFLEFLEAEVQTQLTQKYNWVTLIRKRYDFFLVQATTGLVRLFEDFSVQLSGTWSSNQAVSAALSLTTSLTRDPYQDKVHFSPQSQSTLGTASVNVFIDENNNGVRDEGEKGYENATISFSQRSDELQTDADGFCFMDRLQVYQPVDVHVMTKSLQDPFLRQATPGIRFYPYPGRTTELQLPLIKIGMIDGVVQFSTQKSVRPARNIVVALLKPGTDEVIQKTRTDSDGVYWFESVLPGSYVLTVLKDPLTKIRNEQDQLHIKIPIEGASISGKNFTIITSR